MINFIVEFYISGIIYAVFLCFHCFSCAEGNITKTGDGHQNQQVHYAKLYVISTEKHLRIDS